MVRKEKGFTLIELMIVVAIIGILAAIAYPSYTESVRKSRRADAQGALMGLANSMERYFTENGKYTGAAVGGNDTGAPANYASQAPIDGNTKYYNLLITAATATTYTVSAAPIAGGPQANDRCGTMTLDSIGNRTAVQADCWTK